MSQGKGLPPWHMWGSTQQVRISEPGTNVYAKQLTHVEYARPETWRFIFAVAIEAQNPANLPSFDVHFDVTTGIGRSTIKLPDFAVFNFSPAQLQTATTLYVAQTEVVEPNQTRTTPNLIETIVGQSVYVDVRVIGGIPNGFCDVNCTALLSPNVHIRPDWQMRMFQGQELGGH